MFELEHGDATRRERVVDRPEARDGVLGVHEVRGGSEEDARHVEPPRDGLFGLSRRHLERSFHAFLCVESRHVAIHDGDAFVQRALRHALSRAFQHGRGVVHRDGDGAGAQRRHRGGVPRGARAQFEQRRGIAPGAQAFGEGREERSLLVELPEPERELVRSRVVVHPLTSRRRPRRRRDERRRRRRAVTHPPVTHRRANASP
mmetsp:Transcript_13627/g.55183  ORF Transcript_13627/g.55183 Transcript_13627/m.55183 type:complete len:203 (+) Transcript_13627:515-1123(+)